MNISEPEQARNDKSPLYHLVGQCNASIQGYEMSQNLIAPAAWMLAILQYRPAMVIEIGTCKGGLSNLLSSCTDTYGGEFHTMDILIGEGQNKYPLYGNAQFHQWDCFHHVEEIKEWIKRPGICFVLCDGGNKPREFDTFSDFLKPGDVIAAHDYFPPDMELDYSPLYWGWREVHHEAIGPAIKRNNLRALMGEWFKYSAWYVGQKIDENLI